MISKYNELPSESEFQEALLLSKNQLLTKEALEALSPQEVQKIGRSQYVVQQIFQDAIVNKNPSFLSEHKDHPLWSSWRSKKSGFKKDMICYAINSAKDANWISALLDHLNPPEENADMYSDSLGYRARGDLKEAGNILEKKNLLVAAPSLLINQSRHGSWENVKWLLSKGLFPSRVHQVEKFWAQRTSLGAPQADKQTSQSDVLRFFWDKWGRPDPDTLSSVFEALAARRPKSLVDVAGNPVWRNGYDFFLERYNGLSSDWTRISAQDYIKNCIYRGDEQELSNNVLAGWDITPEDFDNASRNLLYRSGGLSGSMKKEELEALKLNIFIKKQLNDSGILETKTASRPFKKM